MGHNGPVTEHAERPWGSYTVLTEADGFKVKTMEVRPGQRLSYQKHARRSEHWFVVAGQGLVTLDGSTVDVRAGSAMDVPFGAAHRIQNTSRAPSPWYSSKSSTATTSARTTSSVSMTTTGGCRRTLLPQISRPSR